MERALPELLWRRAANCCEYNRMPQVYDDGTFEIDHVMVVSHASPTRGTVVSLRINLDHRLAHRQELIAEDVFPPP
jgi:hypothetical protein